MMLSSELGWMGVPGVTAAWSHSGSRTSAPGWGSSVPAMMWLGLACLVSAFIEQEISFFSFQSAEFFEMLEKMQVSSSVHASNAGCFPQQSP